MIPIFCAIFNDVRCENRRSSSSEMRTAWHYLCHHMMSLPGGVQCEIGVLQSWKTFIFEPQPPNDSTRLKEKLVKPENFFVSFVFPIAWSGGRSKTSRSLFESFSVTVERYARLEVVRQTQTLQGNFVIAKRPWKVLKFFFAKFACLAIFFVSISDTWKSRERWDSEIVKLERCRSVADAGLEDEIILSFGKRFAKLICKKWQNSVSWLSILVFRIQRFHR